MRTSTKILIIVTLLLVVPNVILTPYLMKGIVPTKDGFQFSFDVLAWVALGFQVLINITMGILFFRFLKSQRLTNAIFFSVVPLTLFYGVFMVYISDVKNKTDMTSQAVRSTLNIATNENAYNNLLWAGLATLVYLIALFVIILFSCRPLSKVENITQKLGDGRMKFEDYKVGGGKQFKQIEHSLNKINYNYKEKENKIRLTNLEAQKFVPKELIKFFGKSGVHELELGNQIKKNATTLLCNLKSSGGQTVLSLEENFNYINSYFKVVTPLVKRYDGFTDRNTNEGLFCVFAKPQDAIECAHAILRAIDVKNKNQKELPPIDARISINTTDVTFAIVGDDERKIPSIISNAIETCVKIEEINDYIGTKLLVSKQAITELPQNFVFEHRYTGTLTTDFGQVPLFEDFSYHLKSKREKIKKLKNKFESGVCAYNQKNYKEAKEIFEFILKYIPDDKPSFVYFNKADEKMKEVA